MYMKRPLGLFLLLWMGVEADRESTAIFIRDIMTKFQLTSPTILYDRDEEPPEICYTRQWVLCLPIENHESKDSEKEQTAPETTTTTTTARTTEPENDPKKLSGGMHKYFTNNMSSVAN